MKKWLSDLFSPERFNDIDMSAIVEAFNSPGVRAQWLSDLSNEIKTINMDVDRRLLSCSEAGLIDLCARRKAFQDILESVLSAQRKLAGQKQAVRHNPPMPSGVNLDRVTA